MDGTTAGHPTLPDMEAERETGREPAIETRRRT